MGPRMTLQKTFAAILACLTAIWGNVYAFFNNLVNDYVFTVDTAVLGDMLPNVKSNINCFGGRFPEDPVINAENNPYAFVEYVQLMECSGGNAARDLFREPENFAVSDDYDFEPLLASCRGILKTGAKPLLKLGNVPAKYSQKSISAAGSDLGAFSVNVFPPDDYTQYYAYIRALAGALVSAFGLDEVRAWRFGVMTEYENNDWFHTVNGDPADTLEAYCKLYDYTVQALIDVLGEDVFVGAHSMTCTEGLWDEAEFIKHCGTGTNYATGKTGTRICYLAASYYENRPGDAGKTKTVPEITEFFRETAKAAGLEGLIFGVDEGRVLCGVTVGAESDQLPSRTVGDTWQAAFDARLIKQMFDSGMNYFSSWDYCAEGNHGLPLITYFVAAHAAAFQGARLAKVEKKPLGGIYKAEVETAAAFDEATGTLRLMAYNYRNKLDYRAEAELTLKISAPQFADGEATVTTYMINDDCNWFDEWREDRAALGITDDKFAWSPDDGCPNFTDEAARQTFLSLREKYETCCRLIPQTETVRVKDGKLTLHTALNPNAVAFIEIKR